MTFDLTDSLRRLIFASIFACTALAHAEPPWNVDDPGTTDNGAGIFYLNYSLEKLKSGDETETIQNLAVTLGLTASTELGIYLPFVRSTTPSQESTINLNNYSWSLKHRFWENEKGDALAISGQLAVPTDRAKESLHSNIFTGNLGLTSQLQLQAWKLVAQIAASQPIQPNSRPSWLYGAVLSSNIGQDAFAGIQAYSTLQPGGPREVTDVMVGVGGGANISKSTAVQAQLSRGFNDIEWVAYAGLTLTAEKSKLSTPTNPAP